MRLVIEELRMFGASVDGSLLDDRTWRYRHLRIVALTWFVGLFCVGFTFADHQRHDQVLYCVASIVCAGAAGVPRLTRRQRELLVATAFMVQQFYLLRFVGNFTLAPLAMIILTFYQDWAPLLLACLITLALVLLAWLDRAYFNGARALAVEAPHTGMSLRAAAIILAAVLALVVWRSGTQFARDQLTGMLSRLGAERALDRELSRGHSPVVWVCDIDNFRGINHHLGPVAGDRVLRAVASRIAAIARAQDGGGWICARLGGDTFMIAARAVPDRQFVTDFADSLDGHVGGWGETQSLEAIPIRLSVGAAAAVEGEPAAGMIRAAERNMRDAKGRGARRVVVGERIDRAVYAQTPLLSTALYGACERRELVVYLQPVVQLADGTPVGAEALVRWHHPERGSLLPGEFLPEAERDSALTATLSRVIGSEFLATVGDLVGRHGVEWLPHGYALNLAAIRLRDPLLLDSMEQMLAASSIAGTPNVVQIELTEGALMDLEHGAPEVLTKLCARGYRMALDDFGTGHSSLAHLRDFPLDTVKIDMSFIRSMERSPMDRAVIQAVADIASASGLKVVAEGVETEEQRDLLLSIKPDILAQGWLYAKAMPADEFELWVLEHHGVALS